MSTNITKNHVSAFEALTSGTFDNFVLVSCFVDGAPAAAIAAITPPETDDGEYTITPLFVSLTPEMVVTDHDGVPAGGAS